jgi:1-acyl-sn-glycerol-3-phosphate acyltransferase
MMQLLKLIWLNVWFYGLLVLVTLVAVPTLTLFVAVQAPFISHRQAMRLFRKIIRWYGFVIIFILPFPLIRVRFQDHSHDKSPGPFLVVCNHRSSSDPFLLACLSLPEAIQIINTWTLRLPVWGIAARLAGYLSINDMPVEEFFTRTARYLSQGISIAAFPEGTRSGGPKMGPFHGTVFRLALREKIPIAPLCISGNERMPPRGTMLLYPGKVTLRRLPTLTWESYKDLTPFQLKNRVHDMISRELAAMEAPT